MKKRKALEVLTPRVEEFDNNLLDGVLQELEGTNEVVLSILRVQWPLLARHFRHFKELLEGTREAVRTLGSECTEELSKLDLHLNKFDGMLGMRNDKMAGTTIFRALQFNIDELETLASNFVRMKTEIEALTVRTENLKRKFSRVLCLLSAQL